MDHLKIGATDPQVFLYSLRVHDVQGWWKSSVWSYPGPGEHILHRGVDIIIVMRPLFLVVTHTLDGAAMQVRSFAYIIHIL